MKKVLSLLTKALCFLLCFTLICGVLYTALITGLAQLLFPNQANGSLIQVDGQVYGSALMGQQFTQPNHLWGRIMNVDVSTYTDINGQVMMYAAPSNLSPASPEYEALVAQRVQDIRQAHPEMGDQPIPADLVTCSGSGLDPHISPAAARYQAARLARENNCSVEQIYQILDACTTGRFLGIFGEERVNVLQVNLMLDGILPQSNA